MMNLRRFSASVLSGLLLAGFALAGPAGAQQFTDVTIDAGVFYLQRAAPVLVMTFPEMAEMCTGGAAAGDVDQDGWVDLFVTRDDAPPILFKNLGGTFTDVTAASGDLATALPVGSNGAAFGDIDNDGDLDLYVTSYGTQRFHLFVNQGNGVFSEEALPRGAAVDTPYDHYGMGVGFGDFDLDGYLDIFTTEWWHHPLPPVAPLPGTSHNRLLRNRGAAQPGHFDDVTSLALIDLENLPVPNDFAGTVGFGAGFSDFDLDGHPDLSWVGDLGQSRLLWNNGDQTFTDETETANVGLDRSGMGQVQADLNGDGFLDWFVTAIYQAADEVQFGFSNQLYMNQGDRTFANTTEAAGVANGGWGWGASPIDFDHDGDIDIVHTNGWLDTDVPPRFADDRTVLFENDGTATFAEVGVAHGITDTGLGRGLVTLDYDRDGDMDVFIANHGGPPVLYRNDGGNDGHWSQFDFEGTSSNRDGIGALVRFYPDPTENDVVRTYQHLAYGSFVGRDELVAHFGLGAQVAPVRLVRVRWPSGTLQEVENVPVDTRSLLREPLASGVACGVDEECESGSCVAGACEATSCSDGIRNGWEGDVDCGGSCAACGEGARCVEDGDCASGDCAGWACAPEVAPICTSAPLDGCFEADTARLRILDRAGSKQDRLNVSWRADSSFSAAELGDPSASTSYSVCVYDESSDVASVALGLAVPAGAGWSDRGVRGWRYRDAKLARGPVKSIRLGRANGLRIRVEARGAGLGLTGPTSPAGYLEHDSKVIVQIQNAGGACWSADLERAAANDAGHYDGRTR